MISIYVQCIFKQGSDGVSTMKSSTQFSDWEEFSVTHSHPMYGICKLCYCKQIRTLLINTTEREFKNRLEQTANKFYIEIDRNFHTRFKEHRK